MLPHRYLVTNADNRVDILHFNGGGKGVSSFTGDGHGNFGTPRKDTYADWTGLTSTTQQTDARSIVSTYTYDALNYEKSRGQVLHNHINVCSV